MATSNTVELRIVVSSTETSVTANIHEPVNAVIQKALAQTKNHGRPASEWELRDGTGQVIAPDKTVGSYGFENGTLLYLQPIVGVNGNATSVR
jgi:hypothetical protein